jgi:hypothetical protein
MAVPDHRTVLDVPKKGEKVSAFCFTHKMEFPPPAGAAAARYSKRIIRQMPRVMHQVGPTTISDRIQIRHLNFGHPLILLEGSRRRGVCAW